jgi:alpha- and gamma-adaptin-binding protein p34
LIYFKLNKLDSKKTAHSNQNDDSSPEENLDVEKELSNFENLLSQVMQFRPNTSSMSRDDRLNCAENFAEIFEKLIMQDEDV